MGKKLGKIVKGFFEGLAEIDKDYYDFYRNNGNPYTESNVNKPTVVKFDEEHERDMLNNDPYYPYYSPYIYTSSSAKETTTQSVNLFVFDIEIDKEKFEYFASSLLYNSMSIDKCFFVRNDILLSTGTPISVSNSSFEKVIESVKTTFFNDYLPKQKLNIVDTILSLKDKLENIVLPGSVTKEQIEKEKDEYLKKCMEIAKEEKERCLKRLDEENKKNEELNDESNLNESLKEASSPKKVSHSPIVRKSFETFKPTKKILIPKVKSIYIVCDKIDFENISSDSLLKAQKYIQELKSKDIGIVIYSIDKENIESLAILGADSIELEYENYS